MTKEQKKISAKNWAKAVEVLGVKKGYVLHHKNPDWKANDIERYIQWNPDDLVVMSKSEHLAWHNKYDESFKHKKLSNEANKKRSKSLKGVPKSDESRKHMSLSQKGNTNTLGKHWLMSEEGRRHIGEGGKGISKHKGQHWKVVDGKRVWY